MKNPSVVVVMSTYNGENVVSRQLDSILAQKGVSVSIIVRDDGSKDDTLSILMEYSRLHSEISVLKGDNVGWEKSFLLALQQAPDSEYYAFSDQDDIWFENKLISGISQIIRSNLSGPVLYHCNKISVWENLEPLKRQVSRIPGPLNRQNAMTQEFAQGCAIVMNRSAKSLVCRYIPHARIAHDFWCGLLCYLFGSVLYDDEKYFYHISYGSNASGEGHKWKSWLSRLKKYQTAQSLYYSPYRDLLDGYRDLLTAEDCSFIDKVLHYKKSLKCKISLIFSKTFVRSSFIGSLSLKFAILINKL